MFTKRQMPKQQNSEASSTITEALKNYYLIKAQDHYILQLEKAQPGLVLTAQQVLALDNLFNILKDEGVCIHQDGVPLIFNQNTDDGHYRMAHFSPSSKVVRNTQTKPIMLEDAIIQPYFQHFEINLASTAHNNDIAKLTDLLEQYGLVKREAAFSIPVNMTQNNAYQADSTHTSVRMR